RHHRGARPRADRAGRRRPAGRRRAAAVPAAGGAAHHRDRPPPAGAVLRGRQPGAPGRPAPGVVGGPQGGVRPRRALTIGPAAHPLSNTAAAATARKEPAVHRIPRTLAPAGALLAVLAGCTAGTPQQQAAPPASEPQTITIWHGFGGSASEVKAFDTILSMFHAAHPNITVKATPGQDDDKITAGIRSGNPPDVAVSFTTDNVGKFCQ